ncbi:hypothetical protein EDB85DRAFT_2048755, partial [Lactarius pseudohatsudake]
MTLCAVMPVCLNSFFSSGDETVVCIECDVNGATTRCKCHDFAASKRPSVVELCPTWAIADVLRSTGEQRLGWMAIHVVHATLLFQELGWR